MESFKPKPSWLSDVSEFVKKYKDIIKDRDYFKLLSAAFTAHHDLNTTERDFTVTLIWLLEKSGIDIYQSLDFIPGQAYEGRNDFDKFHISKNVKTVGTYAFKDCVNLRDVYMPTSVVEILIGAFSMCPNLIIHYDGDFTKFQNIQITRAIPIGTKIICKDKEFIYKVF